MNESVRSTKPMCLVVSMYGVEAYLPAFLQSLDQQVSGLSDVQLIFVDDGSPDASAELVQDWLERTKAPGTLLHKENGGLCSARNLGLEHAAATWVSFPDPDDVLDDHYLAHVLQHVNSADADGADLLAARILRLDDETGAVSDSHPLRAKFAAGSRLVRLEAEPENIHLQAASAFYRLDRIRHADLRFDADVKPNFEDAYFTALYLAAVENPAVDLVAEAHYHYRIRSDNSSLVQSSWGRAEKYTNQLEKGYLRLLRVVHQDLGEVPRWVQNLVLYDLQWYFKKDEAIHAPTAWLSDEQCSDFHRIVEQIMTYVNVDAIEGFDITWLPMALRKGWLAGYKGVNVRPRALPLIRIDDQRRIVQVRYFFSGQTPREKYFADGLRVEPVFAKVRAVRYFRRVLVQERILWLPAVSALRAEIDGRSMPLILGPEPQDRFSIPAERLWTGLCRRKPPEDGPLPPPPPAEPLKRRSRMGALRARIAKSVRRRFRPQRVHLSLDEQRLARAKAPDVRTRYGSAWALMDRDDQAHDNAEHLYRYLMHERRDINAWFVLRRTSPDWDRLEAEGFRLVEFGSEEHDLLLLNSRHLVSSQIDHYVVNPFHGRQLGRRRWRYTFLQHGVTKDDLSRWINGKPISRMITASRDEHQSIVGDGTPYIYTEKEVQLTGFPRHDRLLELATGAEARDLILIVPTWRRSLLGETIGTGNQRMASPGFWESDFIRQWFGLLESEQLHAIAQRHGLRVLFLPHPNLEAFLGERALPEHVELGHYSSDDVQGLLARAAVVVSDYSSLAFEAAYIERPVVHFQFDASTFYDGTHVYQKGTWEYATQGFGPVVEDLPAALSAIESAVQSSGERAPEYLERARSAFPYRDGRCCERVVASIEALSEPLFLFPHRGSGR